MEDISAEHVLCDVLLGGGRVSHLRVVLCYRDIWCTLPVPFTLERGFDAHSNLADKTNPLHQTCYHI
eukprot:6179870-Pleurochrysis_carterae.AAC.5